MDTSTRKWSAIALALALLVLYNMIQPGLNMRRTMNEQTLPTAASTRASVGNAPAGNAPAGNAQLVGAEGTSTLQAKLRRERYGPSMEWFDRLTGGDKLNTKYRVPLDFRVLSSMMIAGLASGFRSQVANMLWMKTDEYWHSGMMNRQIPLMEAVVTLDPQFIDAWSTAGWHWAYNIFAEEPNKAEYKRDPKALRARQEEDINTGLDYLDRGAALNPETYRLWFEDGWTRHKKAGIYDDRTLALLQEARKKSDARTIELTIKGKVQKNEGADLMGRTIGHFHEDVPNIDKARELYRDLMRPNMGKGPLPTDQEMALLDAAGEAWRRYGNTYTDIVDFYRKSDAVIKAQIKKSVPEIERIVLAQKMRDTMSAREGQATGAYISITARYLPAWELMKAGKLKEAEANIIGVMNADSRHHLQGLAAYARVLEMRGDAPAAVQATLQKVRDAEKDSSQSIGLHLLARIYERQKDWKQAYRTWYRARERESLNFYARRNAQLLEDQYSFTPPQDIIKSIKASRKGGQPNAAPPPNVQQYQHGH